MAGLTERMVCQVGRVRDPGAVVFILPFLVSEHAAAGESLFRPLLNSDWGIPGGQVARNQEHERADHIRGEGAKAIIQPSSAARSLIADDEGTVCPSADGEQ